MFARCVIFFLSFVAIKSWAHEPQRGDIYATWGPYFYRSFPNSSYIGADAPTLMGFSLAVEGDVDKNGGLEIGLSYLHKLYYRKEDAVTLVEKIKRVKATTGYRHWFNSKFSAAFLFFNAYSAGDPRTIHQSGSLPSNFKTSAHETADNGIEVSVSFEMFGNQKTTAVFDLRYSYSFTTQAGEVADLYGVVVGLKHLVQSKR